MSEHEAPGDPAVSAELQHQSKTSLRVALISVAGTVVAAIIVGVFGLIPVLREPSADADSGPEPTSPTPPSTPAASPVTVRAEPYENYCLQGWVIPTTTGDIATFADGAGDWVDAARNAGGVPAGHHDVLLYVQGTSEASVVLTGIRAVVVEPRETPVEGVEVAVSCGEPLAYRFIEADLDRNPPTMTTKTVGGGDVDYDVNLTPLRFPYRVAIDEPEQFLVSGVVSRYAVDWRIEVDWESQGEFGTVTVDNAGQPFRATATGNVIARCRWTEQGDLMEGPPECRS